MPTIDFDAIHDAADVRTVAETYLEPAREKGRFVCPSCGKGNVTARLLAVGSVCFSTSRTHETAGNTRESSSIGTGILPTDGGECDGFRLVSGNSPYTRYRVYRKLVETRHTEGRNDA